MTSFMDFFQVKLGSITEGKKDLIDVKSSKPLSTTLTMLYDNDISFLPVYEAPQSDSEVAYCCQGRVYCGIVSIKDIILYILQKSSLFLSSPDSHESLISILQHPIKVVIGMSIESSIFMGFSIDKDNTPLSEVVEKMSQGMHRCLVFNSIDHNRFPPKVLTQTDIVQYFVNNVSVFPQIGVALGHTVGSQTRLDRLVSVLEDFPLVKALEKLQYVPAVAVVNEWGQVLANLSASDFRRDMKAKNSNPFDCMHTLSVRDFLSIPNPDGSSVYKPENVAVCVSCDATLLSCAEYMVSHHVHRVWVVAPPDDSGLDRLGVGCVSHTDIIRIVNDFAGVFTAGMPGEFVM